tara:strand:- start:1422 stop:2114 length:693 start_codon:yes stop_codon:yes gene_type:complete
MPTTTIYATTNSSGRGVIGAAGTDWDDVVTATTGIVYTSTSFTFAVRAGAIAGRGGTSYFVNRAFVFFDVSSITTTISAATVKVFASSISNGKVGMYKSTAFGNNGTALAATDFDNVTGTLQSATTYNDLTWTPNALESFPLNATAITDLNTNGYGNYVFRNPDEVDEEEPELDAYAGINFQSSGTNRIQIEITHADAGYGNNVNGVAAASIAKVNTVATADISKINSAS